jgi:hypothetical protein
VKAERLEYAALGKFTKSRIIKQTTADQIRDSAALDPAKRQVWKLPNRSPGGLIAMHVFAACARHSLIERSTTEISDNSHYLPRGAQKLAAA